MTIKTYTAPTIATALVQARRELGPEAAILDSRPVKGGFEVVCAGEEPVRVNQSEPKLNAPLSAALSRLREQMQQLSTKQAQDKVRVADSKLISARLLSMGFDSITAGEIGEVVERRVRASKGGRTDSDSAVLLQELSSRFQTWHGAADPSRHRPVTALVGPTGSGKTSTLVKLAVHRGLLLRRPVRILSLEQGVGGNEKLRRYAGAMEIPLETCENLASLQSALDKRTRDEWILVDTPGYSAKDSRAVGEAASLLARSANIEVQLVLPAHLDAAAMERIGSRFRPFVPTALIFTHVDEAECCAGVIAHSIRSDRPISFLSAGSVIPDDFEAADKQKLLDRLLPRWSRLVREAA